MLFKQKKTNINLTQTLPATGREAVPAIQNEAENTKSDLPRDLHVHHVIQHVGRTNTTDHRV